LKGIDNVHKGRPVPLLRSQNPGLFLSLHFGRHLMIGRRLPRRLFAKPLPFLLVNLWLTRTSRLRRALWLGCVCCH
jgi:hypothetical protein